MTRTASAPAAMAASFTGNDWFRHLMRGAQGTVAAVPNLGVLAFGDSITNGGGELQWGVALQSWALWTARALGLPYTSYALDGAGAADVAGRQIADFRERSADPGARYDVGALYVGANDVRALDWDAAAFERDFREALG